MASVLPDTADRVPMHSPRRMNQRIRRETEERVTRLAADPRAVDRRLRELEREWDIERTLEANASTVSLIGLGLAATVDRRWLLLPVAVAGFLLQHALQGWCPPLPVLRSLGVRTADEIAEERYALKALRGDFGALSRPGESPAERARRALEAARQV
jgi:hypothetical protein